MRNTAYTKRLTLMIPAALKDTANQWFADNGFGEGTFQHGINATGKGEATHYWASGVFKPDQVSMIRSWLGTQPGRKAEHEEANDGRRHTHRDKLTEENLKVITPIRI